MDLLAQMQTFVRVVEGQSLSAAARAQRLSLPAVSRQLRALEADLGATLIARSTRRLHVTEAGQRWYEHCVRVLREIDEARASVRRTDGVQGTVVVSAPLTFGTALVVPRLPPLAARHPRLAVELRLEDRLVDLVGEGVDVAIRAGSPPPDSGSVVARPLFAMTRVVVASPAWVRRHGAPREPEELATRACLVQVTPAGHTVRWSLRREQAERVVAVSGQLRTGAPLALRALALDGAGPAYLPDWLVAGDIAAGRLRRLLPAWASAPLTAWAIHRTEARRSPAVRALIEALAEGPPAGAADLS
ncbi:MAG: LysR family transcriptional regulator [Myxococcales bacterium]|nr:MAG: LysR family transcriptional regulator [Myxococcales bacterium]